MKSPTLKVRLVALSILNLLMQFHCWKATKDDDYKWKQSVDLILSIEKAALFGFTS
jgi:hypothetical protein